MDSSQAMEMQTVKAVIIGRRKIAEGTYEVLLDTGRPFQFRAGQYVTVTLPRLLRYDPRGYSRDFSIASQPGDSVLSVAMRMSDSGYKATMIGSDAELEVSVQGPFGVFTLPDDIDRPVVMFAGGIGVAPFLSMVRHAMDMQQDLPITLVYLNREQKYTAYTEELEDLVRVNPNFRVFHRYMRLSRPEEVQELLGDIRTNEVYICGTPSMTTAMHVLTRQLGVPDPAIHIEEFTGYGGHDDVVMNDAGSEKLTKDIGSLPGALGSRPLIDLEALLQALSETALVSETNADGTITFANDKFLEVSKYSLSELLGQNHRILKSGHHPKAFYENMWATLTRGRMWRGTFKNRAKDGSYYWADSSVAPIMDSEGRPVKYISVRFLVTERKVAEERLQERVAQQKVLTALSKDAMENLDLPNLLTAAVNLLAQTMNIEYAAILRLQQDRKHVVYEAEVGLVLKSAKVMPAGPMDSLAGYVLASNEPVLVSDLRTESRFVGSQLMYDNALISGIGVVISGKDTPFGTLEVMSSKKRAFSNEDISFVQAVANLIASAERNSADRRKDEFISVASHELRTPLTSLKTFVQLMERHTESADKQQKDYLSKINRQVDKLDVLISNLLDISRINTGTFDFHEEWFNLVDLAREVCEEQQPANGRHSIVFKTEAPHGIARVYADRYRVGQVIANLVGNAIKYSPDGGEITVSALCEDSDAVVIVRDQGVGVPAAEKERIFEQFYRGSEENRERFAGGLGLGLYISSTIIKHHNGRIWVKSERGEGSEFGFSLPTAKSEQ